MGLVLGSTSGSVLALSLGFCEQTGWAARVYYSCMGYIFSGFLGRVASEITSHFQLFLTRMFNTFFPLQLPIRSLSTNLLAEVDR